MVENSCGLHFSEAFHMASEHTREHPPLASAEEMGGGKAAPFEAATQAATAGVRAALLGLVGQISAEVRRPRELQKVMGLDYKICWQVINVIQAPDPLSAARYTPSAPALKRFLVRAQEMGVSTGHVDAVREAVEEFARVVKVHADDLESFQSMVSAVAADDGDVGTREIQHRKLAYRSMSQIWGAQTEALLGMSMIRRSASGKGVDQCQGTAKLGLRRLRPDVSPIMYGSRAHTDVAESGRPQQVAVFPEYAEQFSAPLVPEFCSQPLPRLRTVKAGGGWTYAKLATEGIGRQSDSDLAFAVWAENVPFTIDGDGRRVFRGGTTFRNSTAFYLFDLMVHRPSFGSVSPEVICIQDIPGDESPEVSRNAAQLVLREKVVGLGSADTINGVAEWGQWPKFVAAVFGRLGWNPAEFDLFRLRVQFPVFGSVIRVQFYEDVGTLH